MTAKSKRRRTLSPSTKRLIHGNRGTSENGGAGVNGDRSSLATTTTTSLDNQPLPHHHPHPLHHRDGSAHVPNENGATPTSPRSTLKIGSWSWFDAEGRSPFARFLLPDDPSVAYPTARVAIMMLLGFLLSTSVIWLSEDEFFTGPSGAAGTTTSSNGVEGGNGEVSTTNLDFPVHIAFKDVGCVVPTHKEPILSNVTGEIPPGLLTAIMGQSGSGKTTLALQLLGKRNCPNNFGTVYMNGRPRSLEAFIDRVGYVPQDDRIDGDLMVEEAIDFSAQWRLPRSLTEEQRGRIVNDTIRALDLERVRYSRIGTVERRGLSGGERKRVSCGIELVARPSVLILDEAISGLDGSAAYQFMRMIRNIVDTQGVSVVAIVHQPSQRIFDLFHRVILLSKGGKLVYSGKREDALDFLKQAGNFSYLGINAEPQNRSTAEFIMDVLSANDTETQLVAQRWREKVLREREWENHVEPEMQRYKMIERESFLKYSSQRRRNAAWSYGSKTSALPSLASDPTAWLVRAFAPLLKRWCNEDQPDTALCVLLFGTPFPVLPKPGLRRQVHLWFWKLMKISWRRGLGLHLFVVTGLAGVVSYVRSYNMTWNRRAHSNFLLSIAISLLGMVGSVYDDDIEPVKRAAASGAILAAHELANFGHNLILGWFFCHWFSISYFSFLWLRTGNWGLGVDDEWSLGTYYEFAHILHLQFLASSGVGAVICAITSHDLANSFIIAVGCIVHFHVFAFFSPSQSQALRDTKVLGGRVDLSSLVFAMAKFSYARYFMEAIMLWEPDRHSDVVGRTFILRYFSYDERNFSACCTAMFALWTLSLSVRFFAFALANVNDFNSVYDLPLFGLFLLKVFSLHVTALVMMICIHEIWGISGVSTTSASSSNANNSDSKARDGNDEDGGGGNNNGALVR